MADEVGALACIASVILNISPIQDVIDISRTRSVMERSILPYCMMMIDGANWVLFAWLVDDFFPIGLTNGFGCLAGITYTVVYLRHSWHDKREDVRQRAWIIFAGALAIMGIMAMSGVAIALVWSKEAAEDSVGYFVDIFNVCLYASPLDLAWKVVRTGSTSGMYLPLSVTISAAAALWATYGILTSDWFVAAPQSVGLLAGIVQLSLFAKYGVADNNQSSLVRPVGGNGGDGRPGNDHPSSGSATSMGSDSNSGGGRGDEPQRLSDSSDVMGASPRGGRGRTGGRSSGRGGNGDMNEPLIPGS